MEKYDVLFIGSGPAGYVGSIRAAQLGLKAGVIEKDKPGGVCLNIGCIPSKALIKQAEKFNAISDLKKMGIKADLSGFDYKKVNKKSRVAAKKVSKGVQFLLKKNKVDYIEGTATLKDQKTVSINDGEQELTADHIVVATGSRPRAIPGFEIDGEDVIDSTGALMMETLPKRMLVLGSGAIGSEFTHVFSTFGVEIHLVEMLDEIIPTEDKDVSAELEKTFKRRKINLYKSTKATGYEKTDEGLKVTLEDKAGEVQTVVVDQILLSVGRIPNTENIGLESLGVEMEKGNFVKTGDYYRAIINGEASESLYAVGDVVSSPLLAHVASKEAEIAVEHIAGNQTENRLDPAIIPGAIYTEPEVASFGLMEKDAPDNITISRFPYKAIGKATAVEEIDGFIKLITDRETGRLLGASIIGAHATDLIHELLLAKDREISMEDLAKLIHAHPTLSEGIMEAARQSQGWAIHV